MNCSCINKNLGFISFSEILKQDIFRHVIRGLLLPLIISRGLYAGKYVVLFVGKFAVLFICG